MPPDRRSFLRHAAPAGLAAALVALWGCGEPASRGAPAREPPRTAPTGEATGLVPTWHAPDDVRLTGPGPVDVVAYLSRSERRVYVDRSARDWTERRLSAYVSVTSGVWRIPLPGDDPRVPITPGDAEREYEVVDLPEWDSVRPPGEGDVRLRRRERTEVTMQLACVPLASGGGWITSGPLSIPRRDGPAGPGGREEFAVVGEARVHEDARCDGPGRRVRLLAWSAPPGGEG